ncbi:virulence factor family protein [Archangium violaceum]|nr:virulence factor family protein [Archangium violaceum]
MVFAVVAGVTDRGLAAPAPRGNSETLNLGGRFGHVSVVRPPSGVPTTVALLLTEGPADQGRGAELASALAAHGALVLGVDANAYLRSVEKSKRCAYPAGDLELLSQGYQRHASLPEYLHPVLVGDGPGAALVYAALAQAPPGTFRGAVSVDFSPELETSAAFCPGSGLVRTRDREGRRERLAPARALYEPWVVLAAELDPAHTPKAARAFTQSLKTASVKEVPGPGLRRGPVEVWKGPLLAAYDMAAVPLASERLPAPQSKLPPAASGGTVPAPPEKVDDLPLVEVPAVKPEGDTLVLLVSGDGGWASMDQHVASAMTEQGIPVVGLNSLRYFWKRRTPEEASADVARALRHYLAAWSRQRVVLVGYSRGADVVPAIAAGLPSDLRERLRLLALIAPGKEAEFEVHVTDIFGGKGQPTHPLLPDIQALSGTPVLCLYGDEEKTESLCPDLNDVPGARSVMLKGGHHFDGDYASVARAILQML